MRRRLLLPLLLILLPVSAQDDELPPDEIADLVDRYTERGVQSLREGNYDEARLRFKKALKRNPKHRASHVGTIRAYLAVGAYDKAESQIATLLEHHPGDREGRVLKANIDMRYGRTGDVRAAMKEVAAKGGEGPDLVGLRARNLLAEALAANGRRDEARTVLDGIVKYYRRRLGTLADHAFHADTLRHDPAKARPISTEMTLLARALRHYVELRPLDYGFAENALELVGYAKDLDKHNWEAWIEYVRVTRVERGGALSRARKAMTIADRLNPELADLYVEVARSVLTAFKEAEARRLAETALKVNPRHTDARAVAARVLLEDNEYAKATEHIEAGLAVNPNHRDLVTLDATLKLLLGDTKGFEAGMKRVLEIDPTYGEAYHLAGLIVASRQRRYDRAVVLVRKGLLIDPNNFQAHATIGIFLANEGRVEEAVTSLKKSRELLPWDHPIRDNFARVLEYVTGSMTESRTEHFVFRYDTAEYSVTSRFLPELMEECWTDMVKRYGFTPKVPVLVEIFKNADDFSVRTIGLPGIPAIGACFGGLITLDSPQALNRPFLWAATVRHEFAHVMSLQLSQGQVPRWFTEGLSVLEEKPLDTGWGMEAGFERQVYDAYHTGALPKIATFDAMFRTVRVEYAYHVGGLMLQFLSERSGEEGIVKALRLWGKNRSMRAVFKGAFGLELKKFDSLFRAYIGKRVSRYKLLPGYHLIEAELRAKILEDPADGPSLLKLAWAHFQQRRYVDAGAYLDRALEHLKNKDQPEVLLLRAYFARRAGRPEEFLRLLDAFFAAGGNDYRAHLLKASAHFRDEDPAKYVEHLKKAKEAWPLAVGKGNPYALLRRHYTRQGRADLALEELEAQARIASKAIVPRLMLAREYVGAGRKKDAVRVLVEAVQVNHFDPRVHNALLPLYREAKDWKKAIRAARCLVDLRDDEEADDVVAARWLDLAEVLLDAGRAVEAKNAVAEAKKLDDEAPRIKEIEERLGQ